MSVLKISNKTIARIAAIQALYQYDLKEQNDDIDSLIQKMLNFYQTEIFYHDDEFIPKNSIKIKPSKAYFTSLARFTAENLNEIDLVISKYLTLEWKLNTIPILLLALLRVSVCEFKYFPETPRKVIINEFTDIASEMLTDKEINFVNSVLDKIAMEL